MAERATRLGEGRMGVNYQGLPARVALAHWLRHAPTKTFYPQDVLGRFEGIRDISHWNGDLDPEAMWDEGIRAVIMKATEGLDFVDPMLEANYAKFFGAGFRVGFYHFQRSQFDGRLQAEFHLSVLGGREQHIESALDLESQDGQTKAAVTRVANNWLAFYTLETNLIPLCYSAPWCDSFVDVLSSTHSPWNAHWTTATQPIMAKMFGGQPFRFWQWTNSAYSGVGQPNLDGDRFYADWAAFGMEYPVEEQDLVSVELRRDDATRLRDALNAAL